MFSGTLAGALRVGAVLLTAGGMAGGVYFVVQVGERNDATQLQAQATATAVTGEPLSPPNQIGAPTATPPPPAATPPAIDTSDWLTYESPLGFTIKHPPGWLLQNMDVPGLPVGRVGIANERAQEVAPLRDHHKEDSFFGGEAWFEILPGTGGVPFNADEHLR